MAACGGCENGSRVVGTFARVVERYYMCASTVKLCSKERLVLRHREALWGRTILHVCFYCKIIQ